MHPLRHARALWQEFKAFAFKGNMIDLAVAVVIGAAFSGVIKSLVDDIVMPSVTYVTTAAQKARDVAQNAATVVGVGMHATTQPGATQPDEAPAATAPIPAAPVAPSPWPVATAPVAPSPWPVAAPTQVPGVPFVFAEEKVVDFSWKIGRIRIGNFIAQLLNFMLIAFAVFIIIVKLLGSVVKRVGSTPSASEPTEKECPFCLLVIPFKARKCGHCTADLPDSSASANAY